MGYPGIVHTINHPLIPPPSTFQTLFLFQRHFSTLVCTLVLILDLNLTYNPPSSDFRAPIRGFDKRN